MMRGLVLSVEHPGGGWLFAAVDPSAKFIDPAIAATRFGARLKPFANEAAAQAALDAALAGQFCEAVMCAQE